MTGRLFATVTLASGVAALGAFAGCTSYTYNCNVPDACRAADAAAPGVHVVTGVRGASNPPATPAAVPPSR